MIAPELVTGQANVRLVEPNVERDAALGVQWLAGKDGRDTLERMGVTDSDNRPSTLEQERGRVQEFIDTKSQLYWMIELDGQVVGAIWIDLEPHESLPAPALHIMLGDPNARGKGIGTMAMTAVLDYLRQLGHKQVYSRNLTKNIPAAKLLGSLKFDPLGAEYIDNDGLHWQNRSLTL